MGVGSGELPGKAG